MTYYPIIIPTLNRYDHFRRCVESLAACTHADKTELVIGLDYPPAEKYVEGYNLIKAYIPTIQGFGKITIFEHKENLGPEGNWIFLADYCFERYDAYIGSEDDNVFSPCFLDYMNKALEKYKDDPQIRSVCGYNHPDFYSQDGAKIYLNKETCAWGFGQWKDKENLIKEKLCDKKYFVDVVGSYSKLRKIINVYPSLYFMLRNMVKENKNFGDIKRTTINILEGGYQLRPTVSLVRNNGFDGSGIHCEQSEEYSEQTYSCESVFDMPDSYGIFETESNKKALKSHFLSKDHYEEEITTIEEVVKCDVIPLYRFYSQLRHKIHITKQKIFK